MLHDLSRPKEFVSTKLALPKTLKAVVESEKGIGLEERLKHSR